MSRDSRPCSIFLLAVLLLIAGHAHAEDDLPRIHRIVIHGLERTDEQVIRRELLFAEGDVLDSTRVAETARNLRRLFFIGEVHIRWLDRPDGVEVTVSVEDLYSRALSPLISGQIDELSFGVVALDYNFRGRGQRLRLGLGRPEPFPALGPSCSLPSRASAVADAPYRPSSPQVPKAMPMP